eukprot:CCRYP_020872-RA/>CCRYP_020872-RA protein AED:0.44 eAED:0.44 QI:0/-1/0/1/-1/0/1/0/97
MVTTGTKHAIQCGAFTDAWKEWNRIPRANQTWLACENALDTCLQEQKSSNASPVANSRQILQSRPPTTNFASQMVTPLNNLAPLQSKRTKLSRNSSK